MIANPTDPRVLVGHNLLRHSRRAIGFRSLQAFCKIYLGRHFEAEPCQLHLELFDILPNATRHENRGIRLACAAPRDHAKSTIVTFGFPLWCLCYQLESHVILISQAAEQIHEKLANIKAELENNEFFQQDFPEVCGGPRGIPWRKDSIVLRTGAKVVALGTDQKVRGRIHRSKRPSLILLDDIENEKDVRMEETRIHKREWFEGAVLKAGDADTNVIVVGNLLDPDSLLSNLVDRERSPRWQSIVHKAVIAEPTNEQLWQHWDKLYLEHETFKGATGPEGAQRYFDDHRDRMLEGVQVLWPQRYSYLRLREMMLEGRAAFSAEMQNQPVSSEHNVFQTEDFHYWTETYKDVAELLQFLGSRALFYGACDPSLGKLGKKSDDSAIAIIVKDSHSGIMYVLDVDIRRRQPIEIASAIVEAHHHQQLEAFAIEAVQFQYMLVSDVRRLSFKQNVRTEIVPVYPKEDKVARVQRLQSLMRRGILQFGSFQSKLLLQMTQFPNAAHDDGPDALEMAVGMCFKRDRKFRIVQAMHSHGRSFDGPGGSTLYVPG